MLKKSSQSFLRYPSALKLPLAHVCQVPFLPRLVFVKRTFTCYFYSDFNQGVSLGSDQDIVSAALKSLDLFTELTTLPTRSFYLTERVVLDSLYVISLVMRLCGNASKCVDALRNLIRMSKSMNMKGMELRASADLVALISPTTMAKRGDNMKLIQDLGDAMKTLSLSSMVTN